MRGAAVRLASTTCDGRGKLAVKGPCRTVLRYVLWRGVQTNLK